MTFSCAFNASTSLAFAPLSATSLAACFAASSSPDNWSNFALYASILSGVLPAVSAFFNASASVAKVCFWSGVAAVTKPAFAFSNAAFLSFTFDTAAATCSGVALALSNTFCASVISAVAASLAAVYAARLSAVLPVGASSPVNPSNAVFACVKAVVSALSTNFAFAASMASFFLFTAANASSTSSLFGFSFATTCSAPGITEEASFFAVV